MSDRRSTRGWTRPDTDRAATASRAAWRSLPWIAIVTLTAVVQFIRAAPIDGMVFAVVAVALLADALGMLPRIRPLARPGRLPVLAAALAACLLLVFTPRHGVVDGIVLVGLGLAVIVGGWPGLRAAHDAGRPNEGPEGRTGDRPGTPVAAIRRTAILWAAVAIATCLWELTSFVLGRVLPEQKAQHPAISDLLDPALDQFWFRALFVVGWVALGLALVSRGARR